MRPLEETNIWNIPVAFLDFETTGLFSGTGDRVIEIAVIRAKTLDDPEPIRFQHLVHPSMSVPPESIAIHGISDEMLADAPPFSDIIDDADKLLTGAMLVAHHAPFDIGFLAAECAIADRSMPNHGPVLDTLKLARALFGFPSCGLSSLAERMGVPLTNHHRALADCTATFAVCRRMLECIDPTRRLTVRTLNERIQQMTQGGSKRGEMKQLFKRAAREHSTLEIDYTRIQGAGALKTTRRITVQAWHPPNLEAWCHLRNEKRVFRLDRIQQVRQLNEPN